MDLGLTDKVAVVTGAGAGIGLAVTRALAEESARVIAGSRGTEALDGLERVTGIAIDLSPADAPAMRAWRRTPPPRQGRGHTALPQGGTSVRAWRARERRALTQPSHQPSVRYRRGTGCIVHYVQSMRGRGQRARWGPSWSDLSPGSPGSSPGVGFANRLQIATFSVAAPPQLRPSVSALTAGASAFKRGCRAKLAESGAAAVRPS